MTFGWVLVAGAFVLALIAVSLEGTRVSYYPDVTVPNPNRLPLFIFSGAMGNLGVLLLCIGYIVRAISFLPGRDGAFEASPPRAGHLANPAERFDAAERESEPYEPENEFGLAPEESAEIAPVDNDNSPQEQSNAFLFVMVGTAVAIVFLTVLYVAFGGRA